MKLRLASILFAVSIMATVISCEEMKTGEGELPPLAGELVLTDVVGTSAARVSPNYVLGVELSNESGAVLEAVFSCAAPTLQAGTYTEASAGYATAGNFITGAEGTKLSLNGEEHLVTAGTIKVTVSDGNYTFEGIVKLSNGENYTVSWTGSGLAWTGLPELKTLSVVTLVQKNQNKTITLNLSDGNFTKNTSYNDQWQPVTTYTGAGNYLSVDFYSEDGYLAAGTYKPSANPQAPAKGEYATGYEFDWSQMGGQGISYFGTNWWTVDSASETPEVAEAITTGNITVAVNDEGVFTITVDNGELYVQFTGKIPEITKPAVPADPWAMEGDIVIEMTEGLSFTMTDDTEGQTTSAGAALSGVTLYYVEVQDETGNNVAILDLVVKAGQKSIVGEYKVTSYPDEAGEAGNGFYIDQSLWGGQGIMSGGVIVYGDDGSVNVIDADKSQVKVTEEKGQTTIIIKGTTTTTDMTTYVSTTKTIAAKYVIGEPEEEGGEGGACGCDCEGCKDCTGGGGNDDGEEAFNGEILTLFGGLTSNVANGTNSVTVQLAGPGFSMEVPYPEYAPDYKEMTGVGNYLKFDAYSKDGKLAAGTYRASAVGGTINEGEFGIGWDPGDIYNIGVEFTNWGTCWMTRNKDKSETGIKVTDGTLTVEVSGETYTITLESTTVNARYVGPLK